jgi:hypothetical protein
MDFTCLTAGHFAYQDGSSSTCSAGDAGTQEAPDWQEARRGKSFSVPVYDVDGKTVVGEFVIGRANGH